MKKKYLTPESEIVEFEVYDVLGVSGDIEASDSSGEPETPVFPA